VICRRIIPALLLGAALAPFLILRAQEDPYPTGLQAGRDLAAGLRAIKPEENADWHGVLGIFGRRPKVQPVPIACHVEVGISNWTTTYVTSPVETNLAEKFVIIFDTNGPNRYFSARAPAPGKAPGELRPLTGAEADIPIAGSDFWLSDLGLEFLHWPDQDRLKGEMRHSRPCYVLLSTNPHPGPGSYSRVKTWIEKESGQPLEAESYFANRTNTVMKSFSIEKVAKTNDRYTVKRMEISAEDHHWTRLDIDVPDAGK